MVHEYKKAFLKEGVFRDLIRCMHCVCINLLLDRQNITTKMPKKTSENRNNYEFILCVFNSYSTDKEKKGEESDAMRRLGERTALTRNDWNLDKSTTSG